MFRWVAVAFAHIEGLVEALDFAFSLLGPLSELLGGKARLKQKHSRAAGQGSKPWKYLQIAPCRTQRWHGCCRC